MGHKSLGPRPEKEKEKKPNPPRPEPDRAAARCTPVHSPRTPEVPLPDRAMAAAAAEFMELALEQAKFALDNLEVPVGLQGMLRWKQLISCLGSGRAWDLISHRSRRSLQDAIFMSHVSLA